jgi:hypothetical protein
MTPQRKWHQVGQSTKSGNALHASYMHLPRQTITTRSSWLSGILKTGSGGWIAELVRSGTLITYFLNPRARRASMASGAYIATDRMMSTILFLHKNEQRNFPCQKGVTVVPCPSFTSILHSLIMKLFLLCHCTTFVPPPQPLRPASRQPLSFFASAAAQVLCLCRHTFADCCFLLLLSALLSLVLCSIYRVSAAVVVLHLILPLSLVCCCACWALVDCCLLLVVTPLLPLCHHSCCLSVVICHVVCRGAALCTKMNMKAG